MKELTFYVCMSSYAISNVSLPVRYGIKFSLPASLPLSLLFDFRFTIRSQEVQFENYNNLPPYIYLEAIHSR